MGHAAEELEATQNEVKSSMQSHADQDLVILVTLGGWVRGTQVVTSAIMQNYNEQSAKVLRQPALVHFMQSKINEISPELRNEPLVKDVNEEVGKIEKLVSFPEGKAPDVEQVRKINQAVGKLMAEIEKQRSTKMNRSLLISLSVLVLAVSGTVRGDTDAEVQARKDALELRRRFQTTASRSETDIGAGSPNRMITR